MVDRSIPTKVKQQSGNNSDEEFNPQNENLFGPRPHSLNLRNINVLNFKSQNSKSNHYTSSDESDNEQNDLSSILFCQEHKNRESEYFCVACLTNLCLECIKPIVTKAELRHKNHQILSMNEATDFLKLESQKNKDLLIARKQSYQVEQHGLQFNYQELELAKQAVEENLNQTGNSLIELINQKIFLAKQEISQNIDQKLDLLQNLIKQIDI